MELCDIMVNSLIKIFKTIDNLDEDSEIKEFYKELLTFEFENIDSYSIRYKDNYERIIKSYVRDK